MNTPITMPAVQALHQVEGFDPTKYLSTIVEGDESFQYLQAMYRALWFRLAYPDGKVDKIIRHFNDQYAVVEARVYYNKEDPEDQFVGKGFGCRFRGDDKFGARYLECAETAAAGRALSDAGFGSQFCAAPGEGEDGLSDMGVKPPSADPVPDAVSDQTDMPATSAPPAPSTAPAADPAQAPADPSPAAANPPTPTTGRQPAPMPSVEEIRATMTVEEALKTAIKRSGVKTTMGEAARTTPGALEWYVNNYKGPNNYVRAAAQVLLDAALAKKDAG